MSNAVMKIEEPEFQGTDLIPASNLPAVQELFQDGGTDNLLKQIREELDKYTLDLNDPENIKEGRSLARKIGSSKTALDGLGKDLVSGIKNKIAVVDAERKKVRDTLDSWRDEILIPIKEQEQKEQDRIAAHNARLEELKGLAMSYDPLTTAQWEDRMIKADALMSQNWEEYAETAQEVYDDIKPRIEQNIEIARNLQKQADELERLKREAAEREQKEERERAVREAEERTKAEAAQRIADAEARAKQAEKDKEEHAKRAAEDERRRIEAEKRKEEEDAAARQRDREHRAKVHREALDAIVACGVDDKIGKAIVHSIVEGKVPHVSIKY